ncbi:hypothetical protein MC885_000305 [Smutsia gigantea]|nr:hypothetical protein MC885_000305 [Smutsia gigantea]
MKRAGNVMYDMKLLRVNRVEVIILETMQQVGSHVASFVSTSSYLFPKEDPRGGLSANTKAMAQIIHVLPCNAVVCIWIILHQFPVAQEQREFTVSKR